MIEPEMVVYPIMTGGAFKIHDWKAPTPPASPMVPPTKKSPTVERKKVEVPPRMVRTLKLADEEDESKVEKPVKANPEPTPLAKVPAEESNIQVIEASLVKKRKLKRGAEPIALMVEPAAPLIDVTTLAVKKINVAGFLAARRKQALPPSMPRVDDVAAFLANEPVLAIPVNVVGQVKEPLRALEGSIPSMLDHPLGSNIQHILEDLDMGSKDSVGIADDNLGPSTVTATKTPQKPLSAVPEMGASSRALTPKRTQSPA
jgi:hypothetical protein